MVLALPDDLDRGALISPCERYRFLLWRTWDKSLPIALWIMLNPSTADALKDDATIRRVRGFTRAWGFGGFEVANLYAYRSTSPVDMLRAARQRVDIVGWPVNDDTLISAVDRSALVVCAWGGLPAARARGEVVATYANHTELVCLGKTKDGDPVHPLRQLATLRPMRYRAAREARL